MVRHRDHPRRGRTGAAVIVLHEGGPEIDITCTGTVPERMKKAIEGSQEEGLVRALSETMKNHVDGEILAHIKKESK